MNTKSTGPDPRPYVGKTILDIYAGETYRVTGYDEVEDEGMLRIFLDTEDGTSLTLAWGVDFSNEFRIVG